MKFTLEITCDNAAFDIRPEDECARILRNLAAALERDEVGTEGALADVNGNRCGAWQMCGEA